MLKAVAPIPRARASPASTSGDRGHSPHAHGDAAGARRVCRDLLSRSPENERAGVYWTSAAPMRRPGSPRRRGPATSKRPAARLNTRGIPALGVLDRRAQRVGDAEKNLAQAESLYRRGLSNAEGLTEVLLQRAVMQ